jgi:RimJ/RimL family protein N-acetyltransferase
VLDTRRLQLRAPRIYDFAAYADIMMSDRAIFMNGPFTREEAWASFTRRTGGWLLHGHGLWTVDASTQPASGFVTLGYEFGDPECRLGVLLTERAEGRGIAEEAMKTARAHAFAAFGWDSVVSRVARDDDRCIALMKRLGARRDTEAEARIGDEAFLVYRHGRASA